MRISTFFSCSQQMFFNKVMHLHARKTVRRDVFVHPAKHVCGYQPIGGIHLIQLITDCWWFRNPGSTHQWRLFVEIPHDLYRVLYRTIPGWFILAGVLFSINGQSRTGGSDLIRSKALRGHCCDAGPGVSPWDRSGLKGRGKDNPIGTKLPSIGVSFQGWQEFVKGYSDPYLSILKKILGICALWTCQLVFM